MLGKRIAELRKNKGISQYELAERLGFSRGKLANYEQGSRQPDYETLQQIADYFNVTTDYILGRTEIKDSSAPYTAPLTDKDERDIAKRMEKMREDLKSANKDGDGLSFHGEPMSEEAIDSLLEAIEYAERQTVRINKKYIPKKHRKDNKE